MTTTHHDSPMTLVLVIDAGPSVRTAVAAWLEQRGVDALVVDSAAAGHQHLAVDLAIIDIFMPEMDGLQTIRGFSRRTPRVPVIAVSGPLPRDRYETAPDFLRMAGGLGAAFCLRKPFAADRLIAAIEACLDGRLEDPGRDDPTTATGERVRAENRTAPHESPT
jgi:CheY-like chemotaxis protein